MIMQKLKIKSLEPEGDLSCCFVFNYKHIYHDATTKAVNTNVPLQVPAILFSAFV